jgi:LL-diaminopimelate aminotransferase
MFKESDRLAPIKNGIFAEIAAVKAEVEKTGLEVINLGIGSPDQAPPLHVVERLRDELYVRENYDYGSSEGLIEFRDAIAAWYSNRFDVSLEPNGEVLTLMGSHDGLAHVPMAFLNPGDIALVPDPHYPVYKVGAQLAQAEIYPMPLLAENAFLPDFSAIPKAIAARAKLMILNYPNNPVAAVADLAFFERAVSFAKANGILLVHDAAYSELSMTDFKPPSVLEIPGAKEVAIEFHSVSKTYNIAGCRLGFVVGNPQAVGVLTRLKSNLDYGVFKAIQKAGVAALLGPQDIIPKNIAAYKSRMELFCSGCGQAGWNIAPSPATMFLWAPVPQGQKSEEFAISLLRRSGVAVVPGTAFGAHGEGYVRIAMVTDKKNLAVAVERIKQAGVS